MRSKFLSILLFIILLASAACAPQATPAPATQAPTMAPAVESPVSTEAPPTSAPATQAPEATEAVEAPTEAPAEAQTLTVLAAASLTEPFTDIGKEFEAQNPNVEVVFSFAGSQQLAQQLDQGAPADVFASANEKYMDAAVTSKRVDQDAPKVFVHNRLVVIFPKENPAGLKELKDLAKPGIKLDFAAKEVPVGQYTQTFLDKASEDPAFGSTFKDDVMKNVVSYEDNVKAVLTKVTLGEADGGVVYLSDISQDAVDKVDKLDIPDAINVIATYPIAVVNDSQNAELAGAFVDLVLSPDGQDIMGKYNFVPAANESASTPATGEFSVTDATGRTVTFAQAPQRIVLVGKALFMVADAIYTFPEAGSRIVAAGSTGQGSGNFIPMIDPSFSSKISLESDAGPEQIAAAQPDLAIMKSSNVEKLGKPLEELKIPVVYVDFETPDQYKRDLAILGQIFQNEERAKTVAAFYQDRVDQVSKVVSGLQDDQKPRTLVLYYTDKDGAVAFNVPPMSWMQTQIVEIAGGAPVWEDANPAGSWTKVSLEQVAAWDPDVIFVIAYFNPVNDVVKQLEADPMWQELKAVKNSQLYGFPVDVYSWDQPDTRWIMGLTWAASKLHPDLFPDYDLTKEAQTFYQELYGMDDAAFQKNIQPLLAGILP